MKKVIEKRFSRTILAASIAAIGLSAPLAAQAEEDDLRSLTTPDSQIEVGVGNISDGSYKYGDYGRGLEQSGVYLIGNVRMNTRGDNNASYLEIIARNLGLSGSRDFAIKGGEQGNYGLSFEYGELSKLHSDSFMTPYTGMGSTVLTAPGGITTWAGTIDITAGGTINPPVAGTKVQTNFMTALAANMKRFNVETQRKAAGFGITKQLDGGWDLAVNFKREEKDGTRLTGAPVQAKNPATRVTLLAPEPINYTTDLFDVLARYTDEKLQMQLGYHVSLFDNTNRSLTFDNLYYNALSTAASGGGNQLTGRLGQMPDNQLHRIRVSGGYTLGEETHLSGNLSLGRMTQNEAFLPYDTTTNTMPATASLNGRIDTTHADIKLNSKLTHELDLTAGYKYDDRDNRTAVNTYTYSTADNTTSNALLRNERRNTPLSKKQQALYADLDYHLSDATRLKLGYDYDKVTHTYEPTSGDTEHTVKAEIKHSFGDTASGGLAYAHSDRNASAYDGAAGLLDTYSAAYLAEHLAASQCNTPGTFVNSVGATVPCTGKAADGRITFAWLETPALRKYFLADRKRDKLRAFADAAASEKLGLQFGASYYKERYPEAEAGFGLAKATGWTANFDANLAATEAVSGVFFASFEDYSTGMNSHQYAAETYTPIRELNNAAFDAYTGTISRADRSLTVGLGFKVKQDDSFDWGGDFTHATTIGSTGFSNLGSAIAAAVKPMPDVVSRLNRLELFGKYKMRKDVTLNVKYAYEQFNSTDWSWDDGQIAGYQISSGKKNFIGTGQTSPDYRVHAIGASLTYSF